MTLFAHPAWLEPIADFGWSGVDLFFVLSGYLIGAQLLSRVATGQRILIKDFYIQRLVRIVPAYWAVVALYFAAPFLRERGTLPPLWRFLTFTQNFGLDNRVYGAFSHAWSLCVEEHFYLIFPWLVVLFSAKRWGSRAFYVGGLLVVLGGALRGYFMTRVRAGDGRWSELIYYPTYCHLDGLIVGVAIAAISIFYPRHWAWLERRSYVWLFVGLILLYAGVYLDGSYDGVASAVPKFPTVALGYGLIVIASMSPYSPLRRYAPITKWVAVISYSIYLIHKIIIHVFQGAADALHITPSGTVMFVVCMAGSVAGALCSARPH
jgi:peptidoglycan/LPS O-acetylase OafA/YrhL